MDCTWTDGELWHGTWEGDGCLEDGCRKGYQCRDAPWGVSGSGKTGPDWQKIPRHDSDG